MRSSFLLFALVALLSLTFVSSAVPQWKTCATPAYDVDITNITSNVWPPEKGKDLILNITGINSKNVTSGDYVIQIKVDSIPLPNIDGNIDTFHPLPWPTGNLTFTYTQEIPAAAPSGQYNIHISAVDQDKKGLFCLTLDVKITSAEEEEGGVKGGLLSSIVHGANVAKSSLWRGLGQGKGRLHGMPAMPKLKRRL